VSKITGNFLHSVPFSELNKEEEYKAHVIVANYAGLDPLTPTIQFVAPTQRGYGPTNIVGREYFTKSLEYVISFKMGDPLQVPNGVTFRFLIINDICPNINKVNYSSDLLNVPSDVFSFTNLNFRERFNVLFDKFVILNQNTPVQVITGYLDINRNSITRSIGTSGTFTTSANNLSIIFLCDASAVTPPNQTSIIVQTRIKYENS